MRDRALALALSVVCLLAAPRVFAGRHSDDSSNKSNPKSGEKSSSNQQHPQSQGSNQQHGSAGQQHSAGSGSPNTVSGAESHSRSSRDARTQASGGPSQRDSGSSPAGHPQTYPRREAANESHPPRPPYPVDHPHEIHSSKPVVIDHHHLVESLQHHPSVDERRHAYERYRSERAQFVRPAPQMHFTMGHRQQLVRMRIVPATYHYRRAAFYDAYRWQAPHYMYSYAPRYGLWDTTFLMFALDHLAEEQYAMMFYHHRREPEMQRWLEESNRLAGDHPELRGKLDALQGRMANLEETNVPADPTYVPADAQDVALAPDVIEKLTAAE